jgi:histone H3/H4
VTDAPKATKFLGQIFARVILKDGISLTEGGGLLQEWNGREEPAGQHALEDSLASEDLGSMLESIRVERAKYSLMCFQFPVGRIHRQLKQRT